jgi:hypothetical protein
MSVNVLDVSFISDASYRSLLDSVMALAPKKRSKWHAIVQTSTGVRSKVHYMSEQLVVKDRSNWVTLKPLGSEHLADSIEYSTSRERDQHERLATAYARGGDAAAVQEHSRMVDEAATGNHRGKPHKISVRTRPGEPVRG